MSVCFVMAGGASLGAIQAGMLRALCERGIPPDVIVGNYAVPNGALRRLLDSQLELDRLEETPIPLYAVAADLFSGRELRLSREPALDAMLGSAAIPGVFAPVGWEDTEPIDGGVANNTPISHALELGCDRIYVLPTGIACALPEAPHGTLGMALHAMSLLVQQRLSAEKGPLDAPAIRPSPTQPIRHGRPVAGELAA